MTLVQKMPFCEIVILQCICKVCSRNGRWGPRADIKCLQSSELWRNTKHSICIFSSCLLRKSEDQIDQNFRWTSAFVKGLRGKRELVNKATRVERPESRICGDCVCITKLFLVVLSQSSRLSYLSYLVPGFLSWFPGSMQRSMHGSHSLELWVSQRQSGFCCEVQTQIRRLRSRSVSTSYLRVDSDLKAGIIKTANLGHWEQRECGDNIGNEGQRQAHCAFLPGDFLFRLHSPSAYVFK